MKQTINLYQFKDAFQQIRPDNFSNEGLNALFDWFEQYEEDTGEEIELDVIAICCDFSEYTFEELKAEYGNYYDGVSDAEDMDEMLDIFSEHTTVIPVDDGSIILQAF